MQGHGSTFDGTIHIAFNDRKRPFAFWANCHVPLAGNGNAHICRRMGAGNDLAAVGGSVTKPDDAFAVLFE